ncbi:MAG: type II toxin-antitoxin system PemK/MazF family toxin [Planctomycetes bacterium]|nr:type II toxin-antitoxin system PemK/MazF family toxin [Planctomycetota bacterium]
MNRGEVFLVHLSPRSGSEQKGTRPAVLISHNVFNQSPSWRSLIVVPVSTSQAQARRGPTAVFIPAGVAGLTRDSVALCHQVTTIDRSKVTRPLGSLPPPYLRQLEAGLKVAMALP